MTLFCTIEIMIVDANINNAIKLLHEFSTSLNLQIMRNKYTAMNSTEVQNPHRMTTVTLVAHVHRGLISLIPRTDLLP